MWIDFKKIRLRETYCFICKKYKEFKNCKIYICYKTFLFSSILNKCESEYEKKNMEEESVEILKILGLITNMEKYQKIYNHVCRKHKSRI